ncbi:hypothetical protein GCM10020331_036670 [Ectobacillus funiculus]
MLNQKIADATNKTVYAGPVEATAIGNLVAQLMALGEIDNLNEARELIQQSFEVKKTFEKNRGLYKLRAQKGNEDYDNETKL